MGLFPYEGVRNETVENLFFKKPIDRCQLAT